MAFLLFVRKLALKIIEMIKQLTLYSTSHCHLCEKAHALLMQLPDGFMLEVLDIAEDEALLAHYGLHIPVLHRHDTKAELNWPFSEADIANFLK
jgi:Glutaredoxin-like domain (DUF836)